MHASTHSFGNASVICSVSQSVRSGVEYSTEGDSPPTSHNDLSMQLWCAKALAKAQQMLSLLKQPSIRDQELTKKQVCFTMFAIYHTGHMLINEQLCQLDGGSQHDKEELAQYATEESIDG